MLISVGPPSSKDGRPEGAAGFFSKVGRKTDERLRKKWRHFFLSRTSVLRPTLEKKPAAPLIVFA
jgi:hypothetical protein